MVYVCLCITISWFIVLPTDCRTSGEVAVEVLMWLFYESRWMKMAYEATCFCSSVFFFSRFGNTKQTVWQVVTRFFKAQSTTRSQGVWCRSGDLLLYRWLVRPTHGLLTRNYTPWYATAINDGYSYWYESWFVILLLNNDDGSCTSVMTDIPQIAKIHSYWFS